MQKPDEEHIKALREKYGSGTSYGSTPKQKSGETRFGVNLATGNFADFDDLLNDEADDPFNHQKSHEDISRQNAIGVIGGLNTQQ